MSEYVPKPDLEHINSPPAKNSIKEIAILIFGFFTLLAIGFAILIAASDWILGSVKIETEISVFKKIWARSEYAAKKSLALDDYTKKINSHLPFPVLITVQCDKDINAYALPGGLIILTQGLLENLKSENGLSFVVGHEVGHFQNRDHIRGLGQQILFAFAAGTFGFGDTFAYSSMANLISQSYNRGQESAADDLGLNLLQSMYGHTAGADELFTVLAEKESQLEKYVARLASTHPASKDRLEKIINFNKSDSRDLILFDPGFTRWIKDFNCPP